MPSDVAPSFLSSDDWSLVIGGGLWRRSAELSNVRWSAARRTAALRRRWLAPASIGALQHCERFRAPACLHLGGNARLVGRRWQAGFDEARPVGGMPLYQYA